MFGIDIGEELTNLYLKSDVNLLADVFESYIKVSTEEYGINPPYCIFLLAYTYQCALKYTDIKLQILQDKVLSLLLENNIRGSLSSVRKDGFVKSDDNKKTIYMDATNLYGHSMSQILPFDETEMWHGHPDLFIYKLEEFLNTPDDNDIGFSVEVDLKYTDNLKKR